MRLERAVNTAFHVSDQNTFVWQVELEGQAIDLTCLCARFTKPECSIVEERGSYYLRSSEFERTAEPSLVRCWAVEIMRRVNVVTRAVLPNYRGVTAGGIMRMLQSGESKRTLIAEVHVRASSAGASVDALVFTADGKLKVDPVQPLDAELAAVARDANLDEALVHFVNGDFASLYKCFEVIKRHAHALLSAHSSKNEMRRFRLACQPERHARFAGQKGAKSAKSPPMSAEEARAYLLRLLQAWMHRRGGHT